MAAVLSNDPYVKSIFEGAGIIGQGYADWIGQGRLESHPQEGVALQTYAVFLAGQYCGMFRPDDDLNANHDFACGPAGQVSIPAPALKALGFAMQSQAFSTDGITGFFGGGV